jgi:hypothetical protein
MGWSHYSKIRQDRPVLSLKRQEQRLSFSEGIIYLPTCLARYVMMNLYSFNELYGFYNRTAQTWYFPTILDEIIEAYEP